MVVVLGVVVAVNTNVPGPDHCACAKSGCLKKYCVCFKAGSSEQRRVQLAVKQNMRLGAQLGRRRTCIAR